MVGSVDLDLLVFDSLSIGLAFGEVEDVIGFTSSP